MIAANRARRTFLGSLAFTMESMFNPITPIPMMMTTKLTLVCVVGLILLAGAAPAPLAGSVASGAASPAKPGSSTRAEGNEKLAGGSKPAATPSPQIGSVRVPPASERWNTRAKAFGGIEWVSRPSRDAVMGFTQPMEVEKVEVVGGQAVKRDQILVRGREGEALAALQVQKIRGSNRGPVDAAKANAELAQIRFDAAKKAQADVAMSPYEFQERRLALESAMASLVNAQAEFKQEQERIKQAEETVERYRVRARFDGIVDLVVAEAGQTTDIQQPVIRVVSIDPLWIELPVPTEDTLRLNLATGTVASVLLDVPSDKPEGEILPGKVLYVNPVVDAAGTRRVRIELPNTKLWPAGTRARVKFDSAKSDPAQAKAATKEGA